MHPCCQPLGPPICHFDSDPNCDTNRNPKPPNRNPEPPSCLPTNSVKALKAQRHTLLCIIQQLVSDFCLLLGRRDSLLLCEDVDLSADSEWSVNLASLGSLVGGTRRPCPLAASDNTTTFHFVTAIMRLLVELGRLHRGVISKVHHQVMIYVYVYRIGDHWWIKS